MKLIPKNIYITSFKVDDIIIRIKPVKYNLNSDDEFDTSWMIENEGPVKIIKFNNNKVYFQNLYRNRIYTYAVIINPHHPHYEEQWVKDWKRYSVFEK